MTPPAVDTQAQQSALRELTRMSAGKTNPLQAAGKSAQPQAVQSTIPPMAAGKTVPPQAAPGTFAPMAAGKITPSQVVGNTLQPMSAGKSFSSQAGGGTTPSMAAGKTNPTPSAQAPARTPIVSKEEAARILKQAPRTSRVPQPGRRSWWVILILLGILVLAGAVVLLARPGSEFAGLSFFNRTPNPTITLIPTRTLIPSLTPTDTLDPAWSVHINDNFDTNRFYWPLVGYDLGTCSSGTLKIENGKLIWSLNSPVGCSASETPSFGNLGDFRFFVDIRRTSKTDNSDYGISFRSQGGEYYYFGFSEDQMAYRISKVSQGILTDLVAWRPTTAIRSGDVNRIGVVAQGSIFTFYINGIPVDSYFDSVLSWGGVGIAASLPSGGSSMTLEVDNLELNANYYGQ